MIWIFSLVKSSLDYIETLNNSLSYLGGEDTSNLSISNAIVRKDGISMKSSAEKGSLISFNEKNPNDEWSFLFSLKIPQFFPSQFAGVYLWYTQEKLSEGKFRGGISKFKGFMAGIEFSGKSVDLILSSNDGEGDVYDVENLILFKDSINHERFRGISELTVKIISTTKNFKIEIYSGEKLLYDNLRFKTADILGDRSSGKYFGLTSYYHNVPHSKVFMLKKTALNRREEHESYEPLASKSPKIDKKPRMFDEVMHSNLEVRHLIANIEHYISYIKTMIGDPVGQSIFNNIDEIRKELLLLSSKSKLNINRLSENKTKESIESLDNVVFRMNDLKMRIGGIEKGLDDIDRLIVETNKVEYRKSRFILISFIFLIVFFVFNLLRRHHTKLENY